MTYEEKLKRFREEKERKAAKEKKKREKRIKEYQAAYRKAHGHKTRKQQARERLKKQKRLEKQREVRENERLERLAFIEQRTISVYSEKWLERFPDEDDLYTLEELHNPPEGETGRINWSTWERLVKECRSMLGNMK